jgi:integrase
MTRTRRKRPARAPTGLVWRGGRAYFDRRHERFRGGRLAISLRTTDPDLAAERHAVLTQLMGRGDWGVLEAIREGAMHISDAQAALREGDHDRLRRMGSEAPRLGEAAERFLARKEAVRASATARQYRTHLHLFRQAHGDDLDMSAVTPRMAYAYLHEEKGRARGAAWAPATQEAHRVTLAALWSMVMDEESEEMLRRNVQPALKRNPWKGLDMPEVRPTRTAFLSRDEWLDLDRSMEGMPWRAPVAIAFLAGLRQSEIRHLRTGVDVILDDPHPLVRVQSRKGRWPWRPKTRRGERDVPVAEALRRILVAHVELGYSGRRYFVRVAGRDRPISPKTSERWVQGAFARAGIKYGAAGDGLVLHSGRHSFASWLAQDGVPLNVIARLLGDTTKVVEETYAHLIPDTYRSAVQHIDRRLGVDTENNGSAEEE